MGLEAHNPILTATGKLLLVSFIGTSKALFGKIKGRALFCFSPTKYIVKLYAKKKKRK